jgi:uncharacterized membrane protein
MTLWIALHILAAVIWVGGMFFAYMALRPAAGPLETPQRLALWRRTFARFFPWVWASIAALLVSGYAMIFFELGGFRGAGVHVHIMQLTGIVMMLLFLHLYFAPYRRLQGSLDSGELPAAGVQLNQIRRIIAANLVLGIVTVLVGSTGRYWG